MVSKASLQTGGESLTSVFTESGPWLLTDSEASVASSQFDQEPNSLKVKQKYTPPSGKTILRRADEVYFGSGKKIKTT